MGKYIILFFCKHGSSFFDANERKTHPPPPGIVGKNHFHISQHHSVLLEFRSYSSWSHLRLSWVTWEAQERERGRRWVEGTPTSRDVLSRKPAAESHPLLVGPQPLSRCTWSPCSPWTPGGRVSPSTGLPWRSGRFQVCLWGCVWSSHRRMPCFPMMLPGQRSTWLLQSRKGNSRAVLACVFLLYSEASSVLGMKSISAYFKWLQMCHDSSAKRLIHLKAPCDADVRCPWW